MPAEVIRARAETFAADMDKVPGRFNLLEINGATVIVDYGHNATRWRAVIEAIEDASRSTRRTCVYSTAGDRRDCDIIRQGELLGAGVRPRDPLRGPLHRAAGPTARSSACSVKGLAAGNSSALLLVLLATFIGFNYGNKSLPVPRSARTCGA